MSRLIEKESKYFKECNVVMLPTEDRVNGNICISPSIKGGTELRIISNDKALLISKVQPQHLYITSNDEIKEGDWFYRISDNSIIRNIRRGTHHLVDKKIIATTDKSLTTGNMIDCLSSNPKKETLPQPSHNFIKAFCEQSGIDKVLVEYELDIKYVDYAFQRYKLKTDFHNTITIKPVKDSWSREEVINLCRIMFDERFGPTWNGFDDWIKENL